MAAAPTIDGDDLLYRFFNETLKSDEELFERIPQLLIQATAVWLPYDIYARWPILMPFVVRDPGCRGNPKKGNPDQWGAPDDAGYLRDDNSLVKGLTRALAITSPKIAALDGARMGREFVAAHIWRKVNDPRLATRVPELNSFVPNLVWLPAQVAKLSDVEGGPFQRTLQAFSVAIYRDAPVDNHLYEVVENAWNLLPTAAEIAVDVDDLNWFCSTPRFTSTRRQRLRTVISALDARVNGTQFTEKVVTSRYGEGLADLDETAAAELLANLRTFDRVST
jgi:hypothetical protein